MDPTEAARRCCAWLRSVEFSSDETRVLQSSALELAEYVVAGGTGPRPLGDTTTCVLPEAPDLVSMTRDELIQLARATPQLGSGAADSHHALAHLAASFARTDDLQTVAALLRLCCALDIRHPALDDVWNYLLAQQQPDGSFGLLSAELRLLTGSSSSESHQLAMTLEVLSALATCVERLACAGRTLGGR